MPKYTLTIEHDDIADLQDTVMKLDNDITTEDAEAVAQMIMSQNQPPITMPHVPDDHVPVINQASVAVATPPTNIAGIDVDADGIPWDGRIHAGVKSKTKDGRWKKKRGISEVEFGNVIGELQERMAALQADEPDTPQAPEAAPVPDNMPDPNALFGAPTPAAPVEPGVIRSWEDVCDIAHDKQRQGLMTLQVFCQICERHGYSEREHGKGQQNVGIWCERTASQEQRNGVYADIAALEPA